MVEHGSGSDSIFFPFETPLSVDWIVHTDRATEVWGSFDFNFFLVSKGGVHCHCVVFGVVFGVPVARLLNKPD